MFGSVSRILFPNRFTVGPGQPIVLRWTPAPVFSHGNYWWVHSVNYMVPLISPEIMIGTEEMARTPIQLLTKEISVNRDKRLQTYMYVFQNQGQWWVTFQMEAIVYSELVAM